MKFQWPDTWARRRKAEESCRGSTGPLSIRVLHPFAEVASDVSSQLSEECRSHLCFHCPSLVSCSKRLRLQFHYVMRLASPKKLGKLFV